jgi:hypothetical protein
MRVIYIALQITAYILGIWLAVWLAMVVDYA